MNEKNTEYLLKTYPKLYRRHQLSPNETCMCFYFECGDGWFKIIDELSKKIEAKNNSFKSRCENFAYKIKMLVYMFSRMTFDKEVFSTTIYIEADQVKEKYGTLRFYVNQYGKPVDGWIDEAEKQSEETCEVCGKPGKLNSRGWLSCLCDEHRKNG